MNINLFLDTETTGLSAANGDKIVEIAIVDQNGKVIMDQLVNPEREIPFQASNVHGITNNMVRNSPTLEELWPKIKSIIEGNNVIIYNAAYDKGFFPNKLSNAKKITCAMLEYKKFSGKKKGFNLTNASKEANHNWTGNAHRALADTLATKSVWEYINNKPARNNNYDNKIIITCYKCKQKLRVPSGRSGVIRCPKCKTRDEVKA